MKRWLPILVLCGGAAARAQSETAVCAPIAASAGLVGIQVTAAPGDYTLMTTTDLNAAWNPETNFVIGGAGSTNASFPVLGRSILYIRAMGFAAFSGETNTILLGTQNRVFSPELSIDEGILESLLWTWSDHSTCTNHPEATKDFGSAADRLQRLDVQPAEALTAINLGFDASDGGETTPLPFRAPQGVSAVYFPQPLPALRYFAASYNPLTNTLDFNGFSALEAVECFNAATLEHVVLTNLPNLKRVCLEDANLQELDLSGNPALEDLRGALNNYSAILVGRGTGPAIGHWCTRDNPQLTQSFQDVMTNFFALRELFIWNDNQSGHLSLVSTNIQYLQAADNAYTSADFSGKSTLLDCVLSGNQLTNLVLDGCTALQVLDAHANQLGTGALDALLAALDTSAPALSSVDLAQNAQLLSETGYAHYSNLVARGVSVYIDWPDTYDDRTNAPGGPDAITFVTTNAHPHMEIRANNGSPTNLLWHWGDGRIDRGTWTADRDFGAPGIYTNYVEVQPSSAVTYFGANQSTTDQGIRAVYNVSNFPALSFLYLYQQGLEELSLAGCAALTQLHLAGNSVSTPTCDQWFLDLDAAVAGPVAAADFYYPAAAVSAASDSARVSLAAKGYVLHPL